MTVNDDCREYHLGLVVAFRFFTVVGGITLWRFGVRSYRRVLTWARIPSFPWLRYCLCPHCLGKIRDYRGRSRTRGHQLRFDVPAAGVRDLRHPVQRTLSGPGITIEAWPLRPSDLVRKVGHTEEAQPGAAPGHEDQAVGLTRDAPSPGRSSARGAERGALSGPPLHPQGHPKTLSNRSAERIFRTQPCARSLQRPRRPDGEGQAKGQARAARGKPPHPSRGTGNG